MPQISRRDTSLLGLSRPVPKLDGARNCASGAENSRRAEEKFSSLAAGLKEEGGKRGLEYHQFDGQAHEVLYAMPSAVVSNKEGAVDLGGVMEIKAAPR